MAKATSDALPGHRGGEMAPKGPTQRSYRHFDALLHRSNSFTAAKKVLGQSILSQWCIGAKVAIARTL